MFTLVLSMQLHYGPLQSELKLAFNYRTIIMNWC